MPMNTSDDEADVAKLRLALMLRRTMWPLRSWSMTLQQLRDWAGAGGACQVGVSGDRRPADDVGSCVA